MDLPPKAHVIDCRWIFRIKYSSDGNINRRKTILVAKGYSQIPNLDYTETFSPVVKLSSIRLLLSYAAIENLEIYQMDVQTSFLNRVIKEDIYMQQPEGYEIQGKENLLCKLHRALYGLKQSPRA